MSLLVIALQIYTPNWVKRRALAELFKCAAAAFEAEAPPLAGLDHKDCLAEYARFTQTLADQRLRAGSEIDALGQRLYRNAAKLGRQQKKLLRLSTVHEVMAAGRVLYRMIDIDFRGDAQGEVVINRCYFSRFYSSEVCKLMSAMDRGLLAGLSNGADLTFTSRITEGRSCCRAHLGWENLM